jgi:hypothetical protein
MGRLTRLAATDVQALGCYAEYVEQPEEIRPALQRAWKKVEEGMVGFVNVKTDYRARATDGALFQPKDLSGRPALRKGRLQAPLPERGFARAPPSVRFRKAHCPDRSG